LQAQSNLSSWELADIYAELKALGRSVREIAVACETNKDTVSRFIRVVEYCLPRETRPSFWEAYAAIRSDKAVHVSQNTGQPEWYTPPEYIEAARAVLGRIALDPATSEIAQTTVRAGGYFTADTDGLDKPWSGRVWLNPPYSSALVGQFVDKLCRHYAAGEVPEALLLVNNATDTKWFQSAAHQCRALCFPEGRIRFLDEEGNASGAPLQGQALLYFGENVGAFRNGFSGFGFIK
jgi:hypothetical protein